MALHRSRNELVLYSLTDTITGELETLIKMLGTDFFSS